MSSNAARNAAFQITIAIDYGFKPWQQKLHQSIQTGTYHMAPYLDLMPTFEFNPFATVLDGRKCRDLGPNLWDLYYLKGCCGFWSTSLRLYSIWFRVKQIFKWCREIINILIVLLKHLAKIDWVDSD